MKYLMSGRDRQVDEGFGINAEAFMKSADFLFESEGFMNATFVPQKHMPVFFLYRHSIELFLKSMIVIFHKELSLPSLVSEKIMIQGKPLDDCHWIDALYFYWKKLMTEQKEQLEKKAPDGGWKVYEDLDEKIKLIAEYDRDSTFFRYPFTKKKNNGQDDKKYAMKKENDLAKLLNDKNEGNLVFIIKDENENIVDMYNYDENTMSVELEVFKETASRFYSYHLMVRHTLCKGF